MANVIQLTLQVDDKGSATVKNFSSTFTDQVKRVSEQSNKAAGAVGKLQSSCEGLDSVVRKVAGAMAAWQIGGLVKDSAMLSARVETLGVVMEKVGKNSLYSKSEMNGYAEAVRKMGITTQESRLTVTQFVQSHLDLAKSAQLARVAQDAAVIGNTNSSESLRGLMHGITTLQPEILRTYGIIVNFEAEYAKYAASVGRTTEALSGQEKQQIALNAVLTAGKGIAGAYEAAMGTVGKQITTLPRLIEEAKLQFGELFKPALAVLIQELSAQLKGVSQTLTEMEKSGELAKWSRDLASNVKSAAKNITTLAKELKDLTIIIAPYIKPAAEFLTFTLIAKGAASAVAGLVAMSAAAKANLLVLTGYAAYKATTFIGKHTPNIFTGADSQAQAESDAVAQEQENKFQKARLAAATRFALAIGETRRKHEADYTANFEKELRKQVELSAAKEVAEQRRHDAALKAQTNADNETLKKWQAMKETIGLHGYEKELAQLNKEKDAVQRVTDGKLDIERLYQLQRAELVRTNALKIAEEDKKYLDSRLADAQKFYNSLDEMIRKNVEEQKKGIEELNALYKQMADAQKSTDSLIRGLQEIGMSPEAKYQSQKDALAGQLANAMQDSGQEQIKKLEEYKQAAAAFAQTWSAGVTKVTSNMLFGDQTSIIVQGKEVIASVVSNIEAANEAQRRAAASMAEEQQRQNEANKAWGDLLVQTAKEWSAEIDKLKGTIGELDAAIKAMEKTITLKGDDQVSLVVDAIARNLAALHEKAKAPIVITTIQRTISDGYRPTGASIGPALTINDLDLDRGRSPTPYALGTGYVPKTGLYLLHQGEGVTPAADVVRKVENTTNNLTMISRMMTENKTIYAGDTGLTIGPTQGPAPLTSYARQGKGVTPAADVVRKTPPSFFAQDAVLRGSAGANGDGGIGGVRRVPDTIGPEYAAFRPAVAFASPVAPMNGAADNRSFKFGDIHIHIPESAAPQRPEDWRAITREYIIPELRKVGRA